MTDRVVEIAKPAKLKVLNSQLIVEQESGVPVSIPLVDIAVLVLSDPQVILTQAVISRLALTGASVVAIDDKFLPAAILLPMQAHSLQTERLACQCRLGAPARKRLWQQVVSAKLRAQGQLLAELHGADSGLVAMAERVRSGDPENLEAQGARRYWPLIFGNSDFRRGGERTDQNQHLDYGYTVLRAVVARAICGAGLHPSIGICHANRYDAFSLAADLMEPFRPLIDRRVALWIRERDPTDGLYPEAKKWLIGAVTARYRFQGEDRSLFDIVRISAGSLADAMRGTVRRLQLPNLLVEVVPECELRRGVQSAGMQPGGTAAIA